MLADAFVVKKVLWWKLRSATSLIRVQRWAAEFWSIADAPYCFRSVGLIHSSVLVETFIVTTFSRADFVELVPFYVVLIFHFRIASKFIELSSVGSQMIWLIFWRCSDRTMSLTAASTTSCMEIFSSMLTGILVKFCFSKCPHLSFCVFSHDL